MQKLLGYIFRAHVGEVSCLILWLAEVIDKKGRLLD